MNYKIREIEEKDYLEVAILYKKLRQISEIYMFEWYSKLMINSWMKSDEQVILDVIIPKYKKENSKFFVLEIKNKIVWFIYWSLFFNDDIISVYNDYKYIWWELNHLFIDENYRWLWYSSKLRDKLFKWFKEQNVSFIEIWVNNTNPSYEIYKKWGFEEKFCYVSKIF